MQRTAARRRPANGQPRDAGLSGRRLGSAARTTGHGPSCRHLQAGVVRPRPIRKACHSRKPRGTPRSAKRPTSGSTRPPAAGLHGTRKSTPEQRRPPMRTSPGPKRRASAHHQQTHDNSPGPRWGGSGWDESRLEPLGAKTSKLLESRLSGFHQPFMISAVRAAEAHCRILRPPALPRLAGQAGRLRPAGIPASALSSRSRTGPSCRWTGWWRWWSAIRSARTGSPRRRRRSPGRSGPGSRGHG